jgi:hypothetical protein
MMERYDPLESPPPEEWLDMDEAERLSLVEDYIVVAHYIERVRFRLPVGGWPRSFLSRASRLRGEFRARYALAAGCRASRRRGDAIQRLRLLREIGTDGPLMPVWSASRLRR